MVNIRSHNYNIDILTVKNPVCTPQVEHRTAMCCSLDHIMDLLQLLLSSVNTIVLCKIQQK